MVGRATAPGIGIALLAVTLAPVPGLAGSAVPQEAQLFEPDVMYDTVVVRGTVDEAEPLFVYGELNLVQLVDSTTVLFGDKASGNLVYADLLTGVGWAIDGSGNGPGEFGGRPPRFSASGGFVHTAASNMQGATWTTDGDLVEAFRYPEPFLSGGQFTMGLLRSGDVVTYRVEFPEQMREGRELAHEIRVYSRDAGLRWVHPLPPMVLRSKEGPDGRPRMIQDGAVTVDARHGTVVWTRTGGTEIVTLDADDNETGRRTLEYAIYRPFVAADGHVWVHVRAPNARDVSSWLVLNHDLDVVRHVTESGVRDAWGDYALTLSFDETGLQLLRLLRVRR